MLRATFQLGRGLGARREQALWAAGVRCWEQAATATLPPAHRARLAAATAAAETALGAGDLPALAAMLPSRERWRLWSAFEARAVFLDIETDAEGITAIGILDARGPRIFLAERDLDQFPDAVGPDALLVTYNGASFDLPILARAFPDWQPPAAHVDLRPVWARLGHRGGLKALEERVGMPRPAELRGVNGFDAARLWRVARWGDRRALELFALYNLYDAVGLRTLIALAHNALVDALEAPAEKVPVSWRGDVLYDVTKVLLAL